MYRLNVLLFFICTGFLFSAGAADGKMITTKMIGNKSMGRMYFSLKNLSIKYINSPFLMILPYTFERYTVFFTITI